MDSTLPSVFFVRIFLFLLEILQKCQKYVYIIKVTVFEQVYFFI